MDKKIDPQGFETYCTEVLKLSAEDVASLYNDAGELKDFSLLKTKDADRIKKLTSNNTNQYGRGLKEGATKLEKDLKEKYEIESELTGVELFDLILTEKVSEIRNAKPEEVLKHPEVIKLINEHGKAMKAKEKEWQKKLDDKEREINKSNLFNKVKAKALAEFENLNPILPGDALKAQNLKNILISELEKGSYQDDGESFIVLGEDGQGLKDAHGNPVSFQDFVKGHSEKYFEFKKAEDRSSSGNQNNQGQGQQQGKKFDPARVRKPKDKAEFIKLMQNNTLTSEERIEVNRLWNEVKTE